MNEQFKKPNVLVKAYKITNYRWRELRLKYPLDEFYCVKCRKAIGIGDRVGVDASETYFLGFRCKECFEKVLQAQRMN